VHTGERWGIPPRTSPSSYCSLVLIYDFLSWDEKTPETWIGNQNKGRTLVLSQETRRFWRLRFVARIHVLFLNDKSVSLSWKHE
jgi:hypothetical protein